MRALALVAVLLVVAEARAQDAVGALLLTAGALDVSLTAAALTTGTFSTVKLIQGDHDSRWHHASFVFGMTQLALGITATYLAVQNTVDTQWRVFAAGHLTLALWSIVTPLVAVATGFRPEPLRRVQPYLVRIQRSGRTWSGLGVEVAL